MIPEHLKREIMGPTPKMLVRFYDHPQLDGKASAEKGRPVHKSTLYIELRPTSGELHVKDYRSRPAKHSDRSQYPHEFAQYEAKKDKKRERPLSLLPSITPELEADLHALGVHTVEQLAEIDPAACGEYLLKKQNVDDANDELRAQMIADATRGARSILADFETQIAEAQHYVRPVQRPAPSRVDESDRGREDAGSVPERPVVRQDPPVFGEINFGTFAA